MPLSRPLSWALTVATINRGDALLECVRLALAQSRPPREIAIVDASDGWAASRDAVTALVRPSGIPLHYRPATTKSSATQRNQAIDLVSSDIVFLIDDDSFMHPDCAAEILALYEADEAGRLAAVGASGVPDSPTARSQDFHHKVTGHEGIRHGRLGRLGAALAGSRAGRLFYTHVLMMSHEQTFMPYDSPRFADAALPEGLAGTLAADRGAYATHTIPGYALTVRAEIARREMFDPSLRYYAALEDADFCHRVARHGALVVAPRARLHHFQISSGRLPRQTVIALQLLNLAFFLRRHSTMLPAKRAQYRRMLLRRLVAETMKDLLSRRFTLPQVAGVLRAMAMHRTIFDAPADEIAARYPEIQRRIIEQHGA
ncbi:glycosyltransferase [Methylobacterium sp. DB0501]|uniref:glycosyltransferase n=1 Tax=Methylobacterium sp. DB0501 TaxID=2709665 RepID=UPI0013ED22F6|nr:glycosyltransferase [Methylobacterium sp. DB0501]NGM33531.1 glycosyltransferase [Methylobacterium sp. DB0501]